MTDFGFFPQLHLKCINFWDYSPFFKMLLSVCISYMFQVICLISYLVFKLEVVKARCQMFRLSCLQHILMWIYWWMRRKFLIKSTVQSKTHVSFDEVLNNIALHTELKFSSVPPAVLQMFLFSTPLELLLWVHMWEKSQATSCPVPDLSYSE